MKLGTAAGKVGHNLYVQPPTAGPNSCTKDPAPITIPSTSVCRSAPATSTARGAIIVTQPFPTPKRSVLAASADPRLVERPKQRPPIAIDPSVGNTALL